MYPHMTDTAHPNNDRFSQCSIMDIRTVLQERVQHCFTGITGLHCLSLFPTFVSPRQSYIFHNQPLLSFIIPDGNSYCGNKVVENGEQCDCGEPGDECDHYDPCCTAKNNDLVIEGCVLKPSAQCR